MTSTSAELNKHLRHHVSPVLRTAGFERVDARNGWAWNETSILVFNIRAVGRQFSEVTGWPPGSVGVWLGVFYEFIPDPPRDRVKRGTDGRLLPTEHSCHMRTHLERTIRQSGFTRQLENRVERKRRDIWWVEPDVSNAEEVASDIAADLSKKGMRWFRRCSDLPRALQLVEKEHDCLIKYHRAAHIAQYIDDQTKAKKYFALEAAEAERIGRLDSG